MLVARLRSQAHYRSSSLRDSLTLDSAFAFGLYEGLRPLQAGKKDLSRQARGEQGKRKPRQDEDKVGLDFSDSGWL